MFSAQAFSFFPASSFDYSDFFVDWRCWAVCFLNLIRMNFFYYPNWKYSLFIKLLPKVALLIWIVRYNIHHKVQTISALTKETKKWGLTSKRSGKPISKTAAHRILNNPFYYGKILCKGELYPHKHPKLISEALFRQCQEIMNSRSQKKHKTFKCTEKPFIFKGLIKCEQCGCAISCDEKIKNGKKYRYLCCTHGKGNCQNP